MHKLGLVNRRNTSFQGECKETRDWELGIQIGDRGLSGRGSHVKRRTKLWEIRGEKQKRNQEIRNRTKTKKWRLRLRAKKKKKRH